MLLLAVGVLYISFVMASLSRVADDEKFDRLRKIQIAYINPKGEENCYKLPESNLLPNNVFYPLKELRDNLWIYFSRDKIDRLRILLLIRDKKIEEILLLKESGINEKIVERQINKVNELAKELNASLMRLNNTTETKELQRRMETADDFYKFISKKFFNMERVEKCYE